MITIASNQKLLPVPILSSGPFLGRCGSSYCGSAQYYDYLQLAGGRFYRHLPMSTSIERNMSSLHQTIASEEKEHTHTQMVHSAQRKEEKKKLAASYNCHYHLFTGTGHGITPRKLQAEEWRLLAGVPYGLGMTEATRTQYAFNFSVKMTECPRTIFPPAQQRSKKMMRSYIRVFTLGESGVYFGPTAAYRLYVQASKQVGR